MRLDVQIDGAARGSDAFKQIRREIGQSVKQDMSEAVAEVALPVAKQLAPGRVKQLVRAGATTRKAYLEVQRRNAVSRALFPGKNGGETPALLYFGGTRKDVIRARGRSSRNPRHAAAIQVAPGVYRAAVRGPRRYRPNPFLDRTAALTQDRVLARIQQKLDARIRRVSGVS